jgi:hypothetical protein
MRRGLRKADRLAAHAASRSGASTLIKVKIFD